MPLLKPSCFRLRMSTKPFADFYLPIVHRAVAMLPPGGGNAATGRWQCCHWAVADGSVLICRRENVQVETAARRCLDGGKRGELIE